jgi:hypothetical protein
MLAAYWDESGSEHDLQCRYMGIVGMVATEEHWAIAEQAWRHVLSAHDLPYFHAVDCQAGKRAFRDRSAWPPTRRLALVDALIDALALAQPRILGAFLWLEAWRALSDDDRAMFRGAWFPCMQECVRLVAAHALVLKARCALTFSRHDELRGRALELWEAMQRNPLPGSGNLTAYTMRDMRESPALQAADLVAYEIVKSGAFLGDTSPAPRPALWRLLDVDPRMWIVSIDADHLAWQVQGGRAMLAKVLENERRR